MNKFTCKKRYLFGDSKMDKLDKMYTKGEILIEKEMSIDRIIKNLRDIRILLKRTVLKDKNILLSIQHDSKNLIDLDSDGDYLFKGLREYNEFKEEESKKIESGTDIEKKTKLKSKGKKKKNNVNIKDSLKSL